MDKETAERILESVAWMGFPVDMLLGCIREAPASPARDKAAEYLTQILGAHSSLVYLVAKEYPDLDPIGEGEERFYQTRLKYQTEEFPAKRMSEQDIKAAEKAGLEVAAEFRREKDDK